MSVKPPFRGFTAILYKEFLVVLRDPFTLFFMIFPPLVEMIAFGYALDTDVKNMATIVLDEDRTEESRQLVKQFENTGTFRIVGEAQSVDRTGGTYPARQSLRRHPDSAGLHARICMPDAARNSRC